MDFLGIEWGWLECIAIWIGIGAVLALIISSDAFQRWVDRNSTDWPGDPDDF